MIQNPVALFFVLAAVETLVLMLASYEKTRNYFKVLPAVFWIYLVPLLLSSAHVIPVRSPLYEMLSVYVLPMSLVLLLLASDVRGILRLGAAPILMMAAGSVGMMTGVISVFFFMKDLVGNEMWSGFGALSGSWIGGSANMIAVKEAIQTPDTVFAPMVIVDTIVPYTWMALLIGISGLQKYFNRWTGADRSLLKKMKHVHYSAQLQGGSSAASAVPDTENEKKSFKVETQSAAARLSVLPSVLMMTGAGGISFLASRAGHILPPLGDFFSAYTWTIFLVTTGSTVLSLTPARKLERYGAVPLGNGALYLVLTSIGARAGMSGFQSVGYLICAGFCIVAIHAFFVVVAAKLMRAPLFLAAIVSQANIGGVASTPIVAQVYHPSLASLGLLLAIAGNMMGTYLGIITAYGCKMVAS